MSITKEQQMAYTEVLEVLRYVPKEDVDKIPKEKIEFYKNNMDNNYNFKIDTSKSFEEQELSEKAKIVLAIIFRDYWATQEQREKILKKEKYDLEQLELEKRRKYNPDNIFKTKNTIETNDEEKELVVYKKEKWYESFIKFMKNIFKIGDMKK